MEFNFKLFDLFMFFVIDNIITYFFYRYKIVITNSLYPTQTIKPETFLTIFTPLSA